MKGSLTTEVHWKIGKVAEVIRQNNFNIQYFPNVFSIFPNPNSNFNCTPVVLYTVYNILISDLVEVALPTVQNI